jgi:hypothetical protein
LFSCRQGEAGVKRETSKSRTRAILSAVVLCEGLKIYKNGDKQNKVIDNKANKYYNFNK